MTREELNKEKQSEILNEEKRAKRKKIVIFCAKILFLLVAVVTIFYLLNTYIFTKNVVVKEERIVDEKLPDNFSGMKIVQFSDLHYGSTVFMNEVKELVKTINDRNPDIVVFTGDLIDADYKISSDEREKLIKSLANIKASIGKYAVIGDEDNSEYATIIKQADFTVLNNSYDLIYDDDSLPIIIIGVGSLLNKEYNIDEAYSYFKDANSNSDLYKIVIFHEPDLASYILSGHDANLLLSGHSHNGNVILPFIGGMVSYEGASEYSEEKYNINGSKLFISSGIGTNGVGVRFLCQPSINFFRLANK